MDAALALRDRKTACRAEALTRRSSLSNDVRLAFGGRMASVVPSLVRRFADPPAGVAVFHPFRGEPDTLPLLRALTAVGFVTALPVIVSRASPLRFCAWRPGQPLEVACYGLMEPLSTIEIVPRVLVVPLAAFDRGGGRLGYGAGYYDATLAALRRDRRILAIGVAFAVQEVDIVPTEPHDERLDAIVTDRETLVFGP